MNLQDAYNQVSAHLRPQVQGTCGLYSFYNAVRMLRAINGSNPEVPAPKKCEGAPGATQSLRQYAKREFKSGQGEILSEAEMVSFVSAWGYKPAPFVAGTYSAKPDFISLHTRGGQPNVRLLDARGPRRRRRLGDRRHHRRPGGPAARVHRGGASRLVGGLRHEGLLPRGRGWAR